jgi:hypothetical protein
MFSPEVVTALKERGLTKPDGAVDREAVADAIIDYLKRKKADGAGVSAIIRDIVGTRDDAIHAYVSALTSLGGKVQQRLNGNGWVLVHVPRKQFLTDDETGEKTSRTVRFRVVTQDEAAIEQYVINLYEAQDARLHKRQFRILKKFVADRHPKLLARIDKMRTLLRENTEKEFRKFFPPTKKNGKDGESA